MIRFTLTLLTALLIAPAVHAADDGGFGSQRFSNQAPSALSGEGTPSAFAADESNPATIEPASGAADDQDTTATDTRDPEAMADDPDDAEDRPPAE